MIYFLAACTAPVISNGMAGNGPSATRRLDRFLGLGLAGIDGALQERVDNQVPSQAGFDLGGIGAQREGHSVLDTALHSGW